MDLQQSVDWGGFVGRLEAARCAPSSTDDLADLWERDVPDEGTIRRLVRLELRYGSPVLALDLAIWALNNRSDQPEMRVMAVRAAWRDGLFSLARKLLRPLIEGPGKVDNGWAEKLTVIWRDMALAEGDALGLKQAVAVDPAHLEALTRYGDQLWERRAHTEARGVYRWATCSGIPVAKAYFRVATSDPGGCGPEVAADLLQSALQRSGDPRLRGRLLVQLMALDRRDEAMALLADGEAWTESDEAVAARDSLVAYARAQLRAAAIEDLDGQDREPGDHSAERRRERHRAGADLAAAGWLGPAIWHLRKAAGDRGKA